MQGPIAQALALTCVGNGVLRGREVAGFWPNADVFRFSKSCDFRRVEGERDELVAADPLAWFAMLRASDCKGLRLHHAQRRRGQNQTIPVSDRDLVGFVGGGPAWLIEQVGGEQSAIWQGWDRLGDRDDPERKIWLNTYLRQSETRPRDLSAAPPGEIASSLTPLLAEMEKLANKIGAGVFAEIFRDARATAGGADPLGPPPDFTNYAALDDEQARLLRTLEASWVFGGMGSWNDVGAPPEDAADYERLSDALFGALNDAICALANSTIAA
jgi:hypothetical protein